MWIPKAVADAVDDAVKVFYVPYAATRAWKEDRVPGEPLIFTGWYWAMGKIENGPFKSRSACFRDAWFRAVNHRKPPELHSDAKAFEAQAAREAATQLRVSRDDKETRARRNKRAQEARA